MITYASLLFFSVCVTLCSMEKHVDDAKENDEYPEYNYYYGGRPTFETKEHIPEQYLNYLTELYDIKEDPLAEIEGRVPKDYTLEDETSKTEKAKIVEDASVQNTSEPETTTEESQTEATVIDNNTTDSNTNSSCKLCDLREEDKQMRIASIKKTILDKLGFSNSNLPNITRKNIPRAPSLEKLVEQYGMQADAPYGALEDEYLPDDEYYGQIHRAYTIGQQPPEDFGNYPSGSCYFDIPESVRAKKIQDATLWVYLERPKGTKKHVTEIYIYIVPEKAKSATILKGPVRYSKTSTYGWHEFKFAHIVHHWVKRPGTNKGIIIQAFDSDGRNLAVFPEEGANEAYYPTLEMATTTEHKDKHHRNKRSYSCSESERIEACCRYPLRVDFVEFGWDWVIAPTGYRANYCSGECRFRHIDNNPNAYLVQQIPEGGGPCCTPNKLYPLAMLYFDQSHTVLYTFMQKMIVARCGCA